jgi:tetratricopeptide (TPR) repeat protein
MDKFFQIQKKFQKIAGFKLRRRQTNYLSERIIRKDWLFERLARLYFEEPKKFNQIVKKILPLINLKNDSDETLLALAGYLYYIQEDFKKAKIAFLKCIKLNPQNLDNWIDLAFTLRHLGEYKLANGILFNFDYLINYYHILRLSDCSFSELKRIISLVYQKSIEKMNQK